MIAGSVEIGLGSIGIVVAIMFFRIEHRLTKLETKVEIIWQSIKKE